MSFFMAGVIKAIFSGISMRKARAEARAKAAGAEQGTATEGGD